MGAEATHVGAAHHHRVGIAPLALGRLDRGGGQWPEPSGTESARPRYHVGLLPERTTPEGLKLNRIYDDQRATAAVFLGSKERCRVECDRLLEEDARTSFDSASVVPVVGEPEQPFRKDMLSREQLRELTAREVINEAASPLGLVLHSQVRRDEAAHTLIAELWWHDDAPQQAHDAITERIIEYLNVWVWDGWSVQVESSTRPLPDVVWSLFARRFTPRKAQALLGAPSLSKHRA